MKLKHIAIIGSLFPILFSLVLFFGVLISADSDDENSNFSSGITGMNLSAEVLKHQPMVEKYAREYGISEYVNVLLAIIQVESGGTAEDVMQSSAACFGAAFLSLHPTKYAEELVKKMNKVGAKAYLVNTGWNGSGKRISIKDTRGIIDAILDGSIDKAPTKVIPFFDFVVPTELPNVDPKILDPRDTYECACQWEEKAKDLAGRFIKNFAKFTGNEAGKALVAAGPKL